MSINFTRERESRETSQRSKNKDASTWILNANNSWINKEYK